MDSYLERLHQAISAAIVGMSREQLLFHPQGRWSAVEVLEHLLLTYRGTARGFEKCLTEGKPLGRAPTLEHRLRTILVVGLGYMPRGRKAPAHSMPRGLPLEEIIEGVRPELVKMDKVIGQCEARFGMRTRVLDHPILGPMTTRQWRKFHWLHGRHHVKQIWRLRQAPGKHAR